jgi:hypothetical protein
VLSGMGLVVAVMVATQSFLQSVLPNLKKGAGTPTTP